MVGRLLLALGLAAVLLGGAGMAPAREPARWERIEPGGRTACARGGKYAFWLRRADPKRVVVFFQGGGGCFDVRSCAPGSTWFDDRVDDFDDPEHEDGILQVSCPTCLR